MDEEIGQKINQLRISQGLTLKDLSEKTNLSISFLSQAERGLTSIAIVSLKNIAKALSVEMSYFFNPPKTHRPMIIRSYEQEVIRIEKSKYIYYTLGSDIPSKAIEPMIVAILPSQSNEEVIPYSHQGEEFVYVLEGIFTLFLEGKVYELYPGDSVHFSSTMPHNWANFSNKLVKIISIISPSIFENSK